MAFRRRNVALSRAPEPGNIQNSDKSTASVSEYTPGVRRSPIDGRLTTSTGTPSLDGILAGHGGLSLGSSILLEESGTTDFAGTLLRHYAAEGVVQGHKVHVVGLGEQWGRELPGLVGPSGIDTTSPGGKDLEKMKIAWRYQGLGDFDARKSSGSRAAVERDLASSKGTTGVSDQPVFSHIFDLAKRLEFPPGITIDYIPVPKANSSVSPFAQILERIGTQLVSSKGEAIHRLIIPTILSPALYPPQASTPHHLLQFVHGLRALLRQYPSHLTAMTTVSLALYPRSLDLIRWVELLSDGVIELTPFPHLLDPSSMGKSTSSGASTAREEEPQGMVKIHKLPIFHERGGSRGGAVDGLGDDLAFIVSRRKFLIKPFNLPPADGDTDAQQQGLDSGKSDSTFVSKAQLEF